MQAGTGQEKLGGESARLVGYLIRSPEFLELQIFRNWKSFTGK